MGFALTLFYLLSTFLTPAELMPALLPYRVMLVLLIITLLVSVFTMLGSRFSFKEPQLLLVFALVIDASLSVLWGVRWLTGAMNTAFDLLFLAGIATMVCWTVTSIGRLRLLALLLAAIGVTYTIEGILAIETGYRKDEFIISEDDENPGGGLRHIERIRGLGVLNDPNDLGQFMLVDIALLGACWRPRKFVSNTFLVTVPSAIQFAGIVFTHSRGTILGCLVLFLLLFQKRMGKFGLVIGVGTGVLGVLAMTVLTGRGISMQEGSAAGRLDAWYVGMQMFKNSPVFGVGYQQFTEHNPLTAHNSYMLCIAELGMPGLFLWLSIIISSMLRLQSLSRVAVETPETEDIKRAARSVFLAFILFATTAWFLSRTYATILFVLVGCAIAVAEIARRAGMLEVARPPRSWKLVSAVSAVVVIASIYVILRIRGFTA